MQLKTILNLVQKHRSFVYGPARLVQGAHRTIEVEVRAQRIARALLDVEGIRRVGQPHRRGRGRALGQAGGAATRPDTAPWY